LEGEGERNRGGRLKAAGGGEEEVGEEGWTGSLFGGVRIVRTEF